MGLIIRVGTEEYIVSKSHILDKNEEVSKLQL